MNPPPTAPSAERNAREKPPLLRRLGGLVGGFWHKLKGREARRLLRDVILALVAAFTLFSLYNLRVQFPRSRFAVYPRLGGYFAYRGCLCAHSDYGEGRSSYSRIARYADEAGLDFVVVTDENTMEARMDGKVGSYGDFFVFCGAELSRPEGRMWFLGPRDMPTNNDLNGATSTLLARLDEHLTVIAMPQDPREPWTDLSLAGFDALEVVNLTSLWRTADPWNWIQAASANLFDGPGSLARLGIDRAPFLLWDRLTAERPVVGLSSVDVRGRTKVIGDWYIKTPSYEDAFRTLQTYVLLPQRLPRNPNKAFDELTAALEAGHCFGCLAPIGDGAGFRFTASQGEAFAIMGDELTIDPLRGEPVNLEAYCPPRDGVYLLLYRDGEIIRRVEDRRLSHLTSQPGVYRIEAWVTSPSLPFGHVQRLWLYSNPIYLR
ncbi:MAG: hypothetical protein GF399_08950 [Candidatus Coatesbacteria bacterium]|nr:hypothetical protein [Candidatus Coatesbacteria bacterium]